MAGISTKRFLKDLKQAEDWAKNNNKKWYDYPYPHDGSYSTWKFPKLDMENDESSEEELLIIDKYYNEYQNWQENLNKK